MRRLLISTLLAATSATLYALSFPPTSLRPLSWFALVPFLVALRRGSLRESLFVAWLWSMMGACVAADWFPRAVASYFDQPMPVAVALFIGVFSLMAAPYIMAFAAAYRALASRSAWALPFLTAAAWVAAELGRGRLLTGTPLFIGNPWGLMGYAHADVIPLIQIASITGVYGVSFVLVCTNAALAGVWSALQDGSPRLRDAVIGLALATLPTVGAALYGFAALRASDEFPMGDPTPVAVIQGNLALGTRWHSGLYGENLDTYLELTLEASQQGDPEIVFWPESSMTFFVDDEPLYRKAIARVLSNTQTELVAGAPRTENATSPIYFNSVFLLNEDGSIHGRYDKQYLVPFAEYFPLRIDVLRRQFGRVRELEHGMQTALLSTRAGPAGVVICNEAMLPEVVGERIAAGAVYLVNPSNDTWISDPKYTEQQFDIASFRAVEQRRYLVRASTAGPSAIIDPWGRTQVTTKHLHRDFALGEIRPVDSVSIYGRVGDLFGVTCLVVVAAVLLVGRRRANREGVPR